VIKNLQGEIEERNKKILRLELGQKAQIITQQDKPLFFRQPKIEMTALISNSDSNTSKSSPIYDSVTKDKADHVDVIGIYAQRNKTLEKDLKELQKELQTAKGMLSNVEKYWSQQVLATKV
jgi:hypothetical protein